MRHCIDDPSVGVVADVPIARDVAFPHCSITVAQKIIGQMGRGGFGFIRTPYLDTFYYAARTCGHRITAQQCFRRGVPMHRITRVS